MEKLEILKMVKEGIITPEEGANLIEALEFSEKKEKISYERKSITQEPKWIKIEIKDNKNKKKLNLLKIPYSLITLFLRFLPTQHNIPGYDINIEDIIKSLKSGEPIDLLMEKNGKYIRIYAE